MGKQMGKVISAKQIKKGMLMSISAQVISLIVSFVLNLIVPKFVDEYQYAYWQTYMLYVSYVGILHFGLLDGIVLRYSQYDYEELDKPRFRSQFIVFLLLDVFLTSAIISVASVACTEINKTIVILVAIGIITRNVFTYTSYTFQITNRIKRYATLIIAQRVFYGVGIIALIIAGVNNFAAFCVVDLCADVFGFLLGSRFNKGLYFGKILPIRDIIIETKENVSAGILLLIANWASNLLIGNAKMIVQWRWGELVFGKVTFAFSVSNLFLNFITAISVVLFPSLKRMKEEDLPELYGKIRKVISPVLFFIMVFYFPGCYILKHWLPKYTESLVYLGLLLPLIVFASKVSLLTNNYLKAYRKEKSMLAVNLISICIGFAAYLLCAYGFNSIDAILVSIVLVIMLRSILSELVVMRAIQQSFTKELIKEATMTIVFMISARLFNLWQGCVIYVMSLIVYAILNWDEIKQLIRSRRTEK